MGAQTNIDVTMAEDITELSEVVVTALGIEREKKALTYSVQDVRTEEISKARELNVIMESGGEPPPALTRYTPNAPLLNVA